MEAAPMRTAVEAAFAKTGKLPVDQSELEPAGAPTGSAIISYRDGRIEITLNDRSSPVKVFLTPVAEANRITWKCNTENIRPAIAPADCK
jgi:hypothetical protein